MLISPLNQTCDTPVFMPRACHGNIINDSYKGVASNPMPRSYSADFPALAI